MSGRRPSDARRTGDRDVEAEEGPGHPRVNRDPSARRRNCRGRSAAPSRQMPGWLPGPTRHAGPRRAGNPAPASLSIGQPLTAPKARTVGPTSGATGRGSRRRSQRCRSGTPSPIVPLVPSVHCSPGMHAPLKPVHAARVVLPLNCYPHDRHVQGADVSGSIHPQDDVSGAIRTSVGGRARNPWPPKRPPRAGRPAGDRNHPATNAFRRSVRPRRRC